MKCPRCGNEILDNSTVCNFCGAVLDEVTVKGAVHIIQDYKDLDLIKDKIEEKYEIIGYVGKGGFSRVFKIKDKFLGRFCALKIMSPELLRDEEMVERFKREAKLYSELEHPNIVPIYEVGFYNNVGYIIMKFIEGRTLKDIIRKNAPLELSDIVSYSLDILSALDYMHSKGIIHRDIKPANIMIENKTGRAILTDFGLARKLDTEDFTKSGEILGTPHYLSPEQAKGLKLDRRTDIYSFGITLFEMATGRLPFEGDNPLQIIYKHTHHSLPNPSRFNPNIPPELERIILKATEKKPSRRFQTAKEMALAFRSLQYYTPAKKRVKRYTAVVLKGAGVVVLALLLLFAAHRWGTIKTFAWDTFRQSWNSASSLFHRTVDYIKKWEQKLFMQLFSGTKRPENEMVKAPSIKKTGEVVFYAYPEAEVYLNNKYLGKVPPAITVRLKRGRHRVRFVIPEYASAEKEFEVKGGEKMKLIQHIFPDYGSISEIVVKPSGVVYIDGKKLGRAPIKRRIKLSKGKHIIEIREKGFRTLRREIFIEPGTDLGPLHFTLEKAAE